MKIDRKRALGLFGEGVVLEHLAKLGYKCIRLGGGHRCFDILASKDNQNYLYSVKTRNHTTDRGVEKTNGYKLFARKRPGDHPDAEANAAAALAKEYNAIAWWATVTVDALRQVYDIYHGIIDDLKNKKLIPMDPRDRLRHKKLADGVFDQRIDATWSNVRSRKLDS